MKATFADLLSDLTAMRGAFDLTRQALGETMLDLAITAIMVTSATESAPDGTAWAPLSRGYRAWKDAMVGNEPIGVLWGLMLSADQLRGVRQVTPTLATCTYGTDAMARIEATKFQEGGIVTGTNQPPRPFYGIGPLAEGTTAALLDLHFGSFLV